MHMTRRCQKSDIPYNIWHVSELSNANGRMQCTLHISAVDDCYILRLSQKVCTRISRQYIHILLEHPRAYRVHNESALTTQRVAVLLIKIKAWFILRQDCLDISLTTMAYMLKWTKCGKSGNGEFPETITKSKKSLDWYNTWHYTCQI